MTSADVYGLIGSLGFPIVFIIAVYVSVTKLVWPFYVKRIDARDLVQDKRHADWLDQIRITRETEETLAKMLLVIQQQQEANQTALVYRLDQHHSQTVQKLSEIANTQRTLKR